MQEILSNMHVDLAIPPHPFVCQRLPNHGDIHGVEVTQENADGCKLSWYQNIQRGQKSMLQWLLTLMSWYASFLRCN